MLNLIKLNRFRGSGYALRISKVFCGIVISMSGVFAAAQTAQTPNIVEFDAVYTLNFSGITLGESRRSVRHLSETAFKIDHEFEVNKLLRLTGTDAFTRSSRSIIDTNGNIRPVEYAYSGREFVNVNLDWETGVIRADNGHTWSMPGGKIYDWESWYASFMYTPLDELANRRIYISERDDLDAYRYGEVQESTLDVGNNKIRIRGIEMVKVENSSRGFEVWVAPDYHNLPVIIKRFNKNKIFELELASVSWK